MPKMPNVHIVLDSADGTGVYNDFLTQNPGQNILQGQIKDVAVSEITFPYDLPNVMPDYNVFELITDGPTQANPPLYISITPGFYTGTELATIIDSTIIAAGAANPTGAYTPDELPSVTYSTTDNRFIWVDASDNAYKQTWTIIPIYNPPYSGIGPYNPTTFKNLLSIMGYPGPFTTFIPDQNLLIADGFPVMGAAPLVFTQFIDIVSNKLTRYQNMRDGSSAEGNTSTRRTDLVARLYVANETSTYAVDPPGTRPFVIHRQFKNQRVFDWTTDGSVDSIDIRLYDDYGQPLATAWVPRPFYITLHAYQSSPEESADNIGYRM
jgi:hypothetical protein